MAAVSNPDPISRLSDPPARAARLRDWARALALGTAAGALCAWLKTPLPWLIGSLVACAIASGAGVRLYSPRAARNAGQWAIGTVLGLYFTREVAASLMQFWAPLFVAVAWAFVIGIAGAWALRRFAGVDPATAFFAAAVGGASEMALQGERHGGRVPTIAAVHSLRIMMVVIVLPFAFRFLGITGADLFRPAASVVDPVNLGALVAVTVAAGFALSLLRAPNVWMIGPLAASAALTLAGAAPTAMPALVINGGQVLIGVALGSRFAPGFFRSMPRILSVVFASTLAAIAASALFALLLARWTGFTPATMVLATSPGGIAEMSLTAKVLKLGVPVVTVFHMTRMVALVLVAGSLYRGLAAWFGWPVELREVARTGAGSDD